MKILIIVDGRCVVDVITDEKVDIRVLDYDTESADALDVVNIDNGDYTGSAYVYNGIRESKVEPKIVNYNFEEIDRQLNEPKYMCFNCLEVFFARDWNDATNKEYPDNTAKLPEDYILNNHTVSTVGQKESNASLPVFVCPLCNAKLMTNKLILVIDITDENLEKLWDKLTDIPTNDSDEIDQQFYNWPVGTFREDIWKWFDTNHSKGVYYLMHERNKKG